LPPLFVVTLFEASAAQRSALAEAEVDFVVSASDPAPFLQFQMRTLLDAAELKLLQDQRLGIKDLAKRTRESLHALSQPLSAVQGRLQLMAAKCAQEDPNAKYLADLVKQVFEVTHQVMKIQQIHREVG